MHSTRVVERQGQLTTKVTCHSNPRRLGTMGRDNTHTHTQCGQEGWGQGCNAILSVITFIIYLFRQSNYVALASPEHSIVSRLALSSIFLPLLSDC